MVFCFLAAKVKLYYLILGMHKKAAVLTAAFLTAFMKPDWFLDKLKNN